MSVVTRVSDSVARPVRTLGQLTASAVFTEFIDAFLYDMSEKQYAALLGLLTILFTWLQVIVENWRGKALLRNIPEKPAPVVDSGPDGLAF